MATDGITFGDPTPEEIDERVEASKIPPPQGAKWREKAPYIEALAWLIEHNLASDWPRILPDSPPSDPITQGNPTPKAIADERAKARPVRSLNVRSLDKVEAEEVEWLWPGRIPIGKPTVVLGRMGDGKSTFTTFVAATVTTGRCWPDTPEDNDPGSVLFLSAEENAADAIRPRMDAFGADSRKVGIIDSINEGDGTESWFSLGRDVNLLAAECEKRKDVRLIIIDPLGSYINGISGYNDTEVRRYMQPLFTLAEEHELAVLLVVHPNKDTEKDILDRASGSGAYLQMARMAWLISHAPGDKSRRLLTAMKSNCDGATETGLACHYDKVRRRLTWFDEPVRMSAREVDNLLQKEAREAKITARPGPDPVATNKAQEFLLELLLSGPTMQSSAQDLALNQGIKESSFRKALKRLIADDGRAKRERRGEDGRWWVMLSTTQDEAPKDDTAGEESAGTETPDSSP